MTNQVIIDRKVLERRFEWAKEMMAYHQAIADECIELLRPTAHETPETLARILHDKMLVHPLMPYEDVLQFMRRAFKAGAKAV